MCHQWQRYRKQRRINKRDLLYMTECGVLPTCSLRLLIPKYENPVSPNLMKPPVLLSSVVVFNTPPPAKVRAFLPLSQPFSFNLVCLPLHPSGAHWSARLGVSIHQSSPKALSIRPPPHWVPSVFLQTQQDERLLERRLLHKLRVHVLLERVRSWKKAISTAD